MTHSLLRIIVWFLQCTVWQWVGERVSGWVSEWVSERVSERVSEKVSERVSGWVTCSVRMISWLVAAFYQ